MFWYYTSQTVVLTESGGGMLIKLSKLPLTYSINQKFTFIRTLNKLNEGNWILMLQMDYAILNSHSQYSSTEKCRWAASKTLIKMNNSKLLFSWAASWVLFRKGDCIDAWLVSLTVCVIYSQGHELCVICLTECTLTKMSARQVISSRFCTS